jgi:predicted transcriptional regulator
MTDSTPPLHPKEREQLDAASTLVVTVRTPEDVAEGVETLEHGDDVDEPPSITFASYDDMLDTLTPRVLDLVEAIRTGEPESINEAARVVDRDVKNVHEELSRLAHLGIVYFEEEGNRKRPVVWFDELVISLPFESESSGHGRVAL